MTLRVPRRPSSFVPLLTAALLLALPLALALPLLPAPPPMTAAVAVAHEPQKKTAPPKKRPAASAPRATQQLSTRQRRIRVPQDYPGIQKAIDAAAPFDTVEVAAGAYTESVVISSGQRGLVLRAPAGPEQTILQGSGDARLVTFDDVDTLTTLEGFTLRNGGPQFDGGALYAYHSKIRVRDCVFSANHTPGDGGALALYESESWLEQCRLSANSARRGGGIFVGGGRLVLRTTEISGNSADQLGGGLYCDEASVADTTGCRFADNRPGDSAGCGSTAGH